MMLQPDPNQTLAALGRRQLLNLAHMSDALHQSIDRVLSVLISILPGILPS